MVGVDAVPALLEAIFAKRARLMSEWAGFCSREPDVATVVALRTAGAKGT